MTCTFVCCDCRKVFRGELNIDAMVDFKPCPRCHVDAIRVSPKFKAPPKNDTKQWAKVRYLLAHGFRFDSVYHPSGAVARYPETLREAKAFVEEFARFRKDVSRS